MDREGISLEVVRFIERTINSVEQLEVLLFLMSNPGRQWTAQEISEKTRLPAASIASKLDQLVKAELVAKEGDAVRYAPSSSALEARVAQALDKAYQERRDTVIQLIYSRPLDHIRIFADAFRIKKEED